MNNIDVLIVGSNQNVGGIQTYIDQQKTHLNKKISTRVYDTETSNGSGLRWLLLAILQTISGVVRFPLRRRPDLVHVHTAHQFSFYRATFYVLFSRYVWRVPVVLHVHGSSFDEFLNSDRVIPNVFQRLGFDAASHVIVLSDYWRELVKTETVTETVTTVPNAVDPDSYSNSFDQTMPTIVFISNLSKRKGTAVFAKAIAALLEQRDDVMVQVAGSGPEADRIKTLEVKHDQFHYHGYVTEAEKRSLLAKGSIFVLPSYAEGLPIAILEAMAAGNAIVSTDVGSVPEVVTEDRGGVIEPGDPEALVEELNSLCESPAAVTRMATVNQAAVRSEYNWNNVVIELLAIYRELLRERVVSDEVSADG